MSKRSRNKQSSGEPGQDPNAWMGTFADLLTLMLTFFVLLLSMGSMDQRSLKNTFGFFDGALGVLGRTASSEVTKTSMMPVNAVISSDTIADLGDVLRDAESPTNAMTIRLERIIDENDLEYLLEARSVPGGVAIIFDANVLFSDDGLRLRQKAKPVLAAFGDLLSDPKLHLRVESRHQQDNEQSDVWQLATNQALLIVEHLLVVVACNPKQLTVAAYGPGWKTEALPGKDTKVAFVMKWVRGPIKS